MEIDIEKLTAVVGTSYNYQDPSDPIRNSIEERCGKIIKILETFLGDYITICEGK